MIDLYNKKEKELLGYKAASCLSYDTWSCYKREDFVKMFEELVVFPLYLSRLDVEDSYERTNLDKYKRILGYYIKVANILGVEKEFIDILKNGFKAKELFEVVENNYTLCRKIMYECYCKRSSNTEYYNEGSGAITLNWALTVAILRGDNIIEKLNEDMKDILDGTVYEIALNKNYKYFKYSMYWAKFEAFLPIVIKRKDGIEIDSDEYKDKLDNSLLLYNTFKQCGIENIEKAHFIEIKLGDTLIDKDGDENTMEFKEFKIPVLHPAFNGGEVC